MAGEESRAGRRTPARFERWTTAGFALLYSVLVLAVAVGGWLLGVPALQAPAPTEAPATPHAPSATVPTTSPPPALPRTTLALGESHSCLVRQDGTLSCWGADSSGQLGVGIRTLPLEPVVIGSVGIRVKAVAVGDAFTCVLTQAGGVKCWGSNSDGQLGDETGGDGSSGSSTLPVAVAGLTSGVTSLSARNRHACAVTASGQVACWGDNGRGQVGHGPLPLAGGPAQIGTPVQVDGLGATATAVTSGDAHSCALLADGAVKCWGDNGSGRLGAGTIPLFGTDGGFVRGLEASATPVGVVGLGAPVVSLSAGGSHTCAVLVTGAVACWGNNRSGQLGAKTEVRRGEADAFVAGPTSSGVPVDVEDLGAGAVAVSAGRQHTCALLVTGGVRCWGADTDGQLGGGTKPDADLADDEEPDVRRPTEVAGLASGAVAVAAGGSHSCALLAGDKVRCWGWNPDGQLGDGKTAAEGSATPVAALSPSRTEPLPPTTAPDRRVVRLIVLDSKIDVAAEDSPATRQSITRNAERLVKGDPDLLAAVRTGFRQATAGRLDPRVEVVVASRLLDRACVEMGSPRVEQLAKPYAKAAAINVVVARTTDCPGPDGTAFGGYDNPWVLPVVLWRMLASVPDFVQTILHEYGHDAGPRHAGVARCTDALAINGCEVYATDDRVSVMSYARESDTFIAPELEQMGLLTADEVFRGPDEPGSVEIHLAGLQQTGTKVVVVRASAQGEIRDLYLSLGRDGVDVRFPTIADQGFEQGANRETLAVVQRNATPATGSDLYRGGKLSVTFKGLDAAGKAIVRLTRKT